MNQVNISNSFDQERLFFDQNLLPLLINWAENSNISFLKFGGSAQICALSKDGIDLCIKLNRKKYAGKTDAALLEFKKILKEIRNIISISSTNIIPIYTPHLNVLRKKEITRLSRIIDDMLKGKVFEDIYSKYSEEVNKYIFFKKPENVEEYYIGYIMTRGTPFDTVLDVCVSQIKGEEFNYKNDFDIWVGDYLRQNGNYFLLIKDMLKQVLSGINSMHQAGFGHFDLKETNILVLKTKPKEKVLKYLLFDFGSSHKLSLIDPSKDYFEGTYQYLPKSIRSLYSISQFTNNNRARIFFSSIPEEKYYSLDIHALSCIILYILSDERYRRICSLFNYLEFEELYALSQFMSLDLKDSDGDTCTVYNEKKSTAHLLLQQIILSDKMKISANSDWIEWDNECCNTYPCFPSQIEKNSWLMKYHHLIKLIHPASKYLIEEMENRNKLITKAQKEQKILCIAKLSPKKQMNFYHEINYHKNDELIRSLYIKKISTSLNKTSFLKASLRSSQIDLEPVIQCKLFKKLKNIHQLALTHYNPPPGREAFEGYAEHTRFEHSLGTLEISRLYLISLLKHSTWLRLRFKNTDGLFLLILSLIHDISHYPCTHYLEDSGIFPDHKVILFSLITGDLYALNLYTNFDLSKLPEKYESGPTRDIKWNTGKTAYFNVDLEKPEGHECSLNMRFCEIEDLVDFYDALEDVFLKYSNDKNNDLLKQFIYWTIDLFSISNQHYSVKNLNKTPSRLIFRPLEGIINGPIDADKLHYVVNDSIHCHTSIAASFEGKEFNRLINSLRIPIRYLEDSGTNRFCLGLETNSIHLAQLLIFTRSALFSEIYWSERARAITSMFYFLLNESFRIFNDRKSSEFYNYAGKIIRASDEDIQGTLDNMIDRCNVLIHETGVKNPENYCNILDEIFTLLFSKKPYPKCYKELCKIYPTDVFAYNKIQSSIEEGTQKEFQFRSISKKLLDQIRFIVSETLHLKYDKDLVHGSIIVDLPVQKVSKTKEFIKFALVTDQCYGRSVGKVWDAIEKDFAENTKLIRIFINPNVRKFDREDSKLVRSELITNLS
jgi:HD superfamily phosphohydrolase